MNKKSERERISHLFQEFFPPEEFASRRERIRKTGVSTWLAYPLYVVFRGSSPAAV